MLGLFAFFYGTLHFLIYTIADRFAGLDFPDGIVVVETVRNLAASVGEDIYKRPFITIGFTRFMLMLPLAVTSTAGMDPAAGWEALADAASAGVCRRGCRRGALLLAGEGRRLAPARLRGGRRGAAWIPLVLVAHESRVDDPRAATCRPSRVTGLDQRQSSGRRSRPACPATRA